jgi:uncharacterized protein (TIGR02284 family)
MKANNERLITILNDLIRINYDRIEGYEKATEEIKEFTEAEIKGVFIQMSEESRKHRAELSQAVVSLGGEPAKDTTTAGDIYRVWMDVKTTFAGNDVLASLQLCEYGEDKALEAYKTALANDVSWPTDVRAIIEKERASLKSSHDRIKRYRDEYANAVKSH